MIETCFSRWRRQARFSPPRLSDSPELNGADFYRMPKNRLNPKAPIREAVIDLPSVRRRCSKAQGGVRARAHVKIALNEQIMLHSLRFTSQPYHKSFAYLRFTTVAPYNVKLNQRGCM